MQRAGFFSHIYVERRALDYPATADILKHFPKVEPIIIRHYKDVFTGSIKVLAVRRHLRV